MTKRLLSILDQQVESYVTFCVCFYQAISHISGVGVGWGVIRLLCASATTTAPPVQSKLWQEKRKRWCCCDQPGVVVINLHQHSYTFCTRVNDEYNCISRAPPHWWMYPFWCWSVSFILNRRTGNWSWCASSVCGCELTTSLAIIFMFIFMFWISGESLIIVNKVDSGKKCPAQVSHCPGLAGWG